MKALVALALVLSSGCGFVGPGDEPRLTTTVSVDPAEMETGDTTIVRVVTRNEMSERYVLQSNACVLVYRVRRVRAEEVFSLAGPCDDILRVHDLAPGDSIVWTFAYDGSALEPGDYSRSTLRPLEPGTYWVQGGVTSGFRWPSPSAELTILP